MKLVRDAAVSASSSRALGVDIEEVGPHTGRMRVGLFALLVLGCARNASPEPPVRAPVPYLADAPFGPEEAGCLLAFLPGAGDDARSYVDHGFVSRLRASNAKVDAWSVDATLEYYRGREIETRVREDVLLRATELGYRRIWLVGISMGGGGALRVAATSEEMVHGVVVFAPFLGSPFLAREVQAAGGASAWQPSAELLAKDDPYVDAWRWVGRRGDTPLIVGWGDDDTIAMMSEALALGLPSSHVIHAAGDHEWVVWEQLWGAFVDSGFLQRSCGVVGDGGGDGASDGDAARDGEVRDGDAVRDGEVRDGEVRDGEVRDGEVRDGEVRDGEVRDADGVRDSAATPEQE